MKNVAYIIINEKPVEIQFPDSLLRDWFAGQALAGLSARDVAPRIPIEHPTADQLADWRDQVLTANAVFVYGQADAMLAERAKREAVK